MRAIVPPDKGSYSHAGMGYANPHAVTQIATGQSTTTYSYDQNGNLAQKTTDGVTTTYLWDYANRLMALGSGGATTTYGYDAFGSRVFQSTATTTTLYPFKWYSVASSTGSGATFATTTEYVFNGDTLVSTVDQQFASGTATGTPQTLYIHPDHLGSTNVVTNASGTVVQTLDYYPYGSTRLSGEQNATSRQFIGEFSDPSGLNYFNNRFYQNDRGQFLSEDPTHLTVGDPARLVAMTGYTQDQILSDPQLLNSYSYGRDNPIRFKDPKGTCPICGAILLAGGIGTVGGVANQAFSDYLTGDFGNRSLADNLNTYAVAAGQGAVVGFGTAGAAFAAPALGVPAVLTVGATAGTLTAGTTVLGNRILGQPTDWTGLGVNSTISALSAGTLKALPGVPGRLPNIGTQAYYAGVHTQRQAAEELFSNSVQSFAQTINRFAASQSYSTVPSSGGGGGGSSGSLVQQ